MQLPQLDTKGNDVTNTLTAIANYNRTKAATENTKKRNKLLDLQLSPETIAALRAQEKAKLANTNAIILQRNLENSKKASAMVRDRISDVYSRLDGPEGIDAYKDFYQNMIENPLTKDHASVMLPNPEDYLRTNINNPTGQSVVGTDMKSLKSVLENMMTAADRKASGKMNDYRKVWRQRNGKWYASLYNIAGLEKEGKPIDAFDLTGDETATFDDPTGKTKKSIADYKPETYEEDVDGVTYKVTRQYDPDKGEYVEVGRSRVVQKDKKDLTPAQEADDLRSDENVMSKIDSKFIGTGDDVPPIALDKNLGQSEADRYNRIAKKTGGDFRFVWSEDVYEQEVEPDGIIAKVKGKLTGPEIESVGGWVKVSTEDIIAQADEAVSQGADPKDVQKRLKKMNVDYKVGE